MMCIIFCCVLIFVSSQFCGTEFQCYKEFDNQIWITSKTFTTAPCYIRCLLATCGVVNSCKQSLDPKTNFSNVVTNLTNQTCQTLHPGKTYGIKNNTSTCIQSEQKTDETRIKQSCIQRPNVAFSISFCACREQTFCRDWPALNSSIKKSPSKIALHFPAIENKDKNTMT